MTLRALIAGLLLGVALLAWIGQAHATVTATELTAGAAASAASATTASVSTTAGNLLVLFVSWRQTNTCIVTPTGLSLSWTVSHSVDFGPGVNWIRMYTAVASGSSGTISLACGSGTFTALGWQLIEFSSIDTSVLNGVTQAGHSSLGTCNNCSISVTITPYTNANDTQVMACTAQGIGSTGSIALDSDPGWVGASTVLAGSGTTFMLLRSQWLTVRGSETVSDCVYSGLGGSAQAIMISAELNFAEAGPKHRVYQQ